MTRVKLNLKGFRELRTDPKVREYVQKKAEAIAAEAGVDAEETESPRNRARSAVIGSKYDEEAILRALGNHIGRR